MKVKLKSNWGFVRFSVEPSKKKKSPYGEEEFMPTEGPEKKKRSILSKIFRRHRKKDSAKFDSLPEVGLIR